MTMLNASGRATSQMEKIPSAGRNTGFTKICLILGLMNQLSPHRQNVYGFLDEEDAEEEEHGFSYKQMEARDSRRWSMADLDHSGELDIQVTRTLQGGSVKSAISGVFGFPSP